MNEGWELLAKRDSKGAEAYFEKKISAGSNDFSDYWGLAKAYLMERRSKEAEEMLHQAVDKAKQAWMEKQIPYDIVETIEKDLDRALKYPDSRMADRVYRYAVGALNLLGISSFDYLFELIENLTLLKGYLYRSLVEEKLKNDARVIVNGNEIWLAEVQEPARVLKRRRELGISEKLDIEDVALYLDGHIIDGLAAGIESIVRDATEGNISPRDIVVIMMNAPDYASALNKIQIRTRMFNLARLGGKWESFLVNLWLNLPRWELAGGSIMEYDPDDLWLGDLSREQIAKVLGLDIDEDGDYCCRVCGEKVGLSGGHRHKN